MKINSESAKRQRMIARRMKSGKPLAGLLAGVAVCSATSGCYPGLALVGIGYAGDPYGLPGDHGCRPNDRLSVYFRMPEGTGMPIGGYTQLQLCEGWMYKCRCEDGRCFLTVYADSGQEEEFEITEHINRTLKASGSDGIIGRNTEFLSKPEVSIWTLRENLALAVGVVGISGKVGERFTGFHLPRCALLRKEAE